MFMRVLIVSRDVFTVASVKLTLAKEKLMFDTTGLGEDGLQMAKVYDYDIILLDLTSPDIDGYEMLQRLRAAQVDTPILVLSDLRKADQGVKFLRFGADDFLTKPFDGGELLARIQAIVRRSNGHSQSTIRIGKLVVNLDTRAVSVDGQPINLTNREYAILELLSLRKGTTVTRETFLNQLYGGMDEPELKTMDVFICKLRKKLAQATGGSHYIEAVWGHGYVLRDPVPRSRNAARMAGREDAAAQHAAEGSLGGNHGEVAVRMR
jgi:two-component system cell cycle response regulator CtrA